MGQHNFNGILSHQIQKTFQAQNLPSRLLLGGILVIITVSQGGPLNLGATPGVWWLGGSITYSNLTVASLKYIVVLKAP